MESLPIVQRTFVRRKLVGFLFALPALTFFIVFFAYPVINGIYISLTKWSVFTPKQFIGVRNFVNLSHDPEFLQSLKITICFVVGTCLIIWIVPLILALLINTNLRFTKFFQTLYFIPSVLSLTVIAIVWTYMYRRLGLINGLLKFLLDISPVPWLESSKYALLSIIIVVGWSAIGYYMIIYLAGLRGIPTILYEAAKIDGANWWQMLTEITFPLLKPTFTFIFIISIISSLQVFPPFLLMTNGGPGTSTTVVSLKIYKDAFFRLNMGKAAAESMVLFLIMVILSLIQLRILKSEVTYG